MCTNKSFNLFDYLSFMAIYPFDNRITRYSLRGLRNASATRRTSRNYLSIHYAITFINFVQSIHKNKTRISCLKFVHSAVLDRQLLWHFLVAYSLNRRLQASKEAKLPIRKDSCPFFFNSHSGGWSPSRVHSARRHWMAYCTCPDDGVFGGMKIGRGNRSTRRKPAPAPLCPPQIPVDQTRARSQALTWPVFDVQLRLSGCSLMNPKSPSCT
jgi:hypothetical protein